LLPLGSAAPLNPATTVAELNAWQFATEQKSATGNAVSGFLHGLLISIHALVVMLSATKTHVD